MSRYPSKMNERSPEDLDLFLEVVEEYCDGSLSKFANEFGVTYPLVWRWKKTGPPRWFGVLLRLVKHERALLWDAANKREEGSDSD